jgi:Uncharacterized conserved protein (COG2071)
VNPVAGFASKLQDMILTVTVRDLVFVSWEVPSEELSAQLPEGLEPELADGRGLVTLSLARAVACRLGRLRVPGFTKLTVHTYATGVDGPGLCFLESRVSRLAYGRRLVGIPFATTRLRVRPGLAEAPELGASVRYRADGEAPGQRLESATVGHHEAAYFESAVLLRLVAHHSPIRWRRAQLLEPPRFEPVRALFDVGEPSSLLYADRVLFRAELPPSAVERR